MILNLLKRVVKATLHSAVDEWLAETGVPKEMIDEVRRQRQVLAAQVVERADEAAVRRLDVDDDGQDAITTVPALPMPAGNGEFDLMAWIHQQRESNMSWTEIVQSACKKGFQGSEDALRSRYKRWREKQAQVGSDAPTA